MKNRKHKSDRVILFATLALLAIGLIVIYAIGPMRANVLNSAYGENYDPNSIFLTHLRSVLISLAVFAVTFWLIPYDKIKKVAKPLMIAAILASILLWLLAKMGSSLARCELGECRWFNLGFISFQPAELLKIALVIYLADYLNRKKAEGKMDDKDFWWPLVLVCGLSLALVVVAQGDLGSGVALIAIIFGMLLVAGVPMRQYLLMVAIVVAIAIGAVATSAHRMERVTAWVDTLTGAEVTDQTYHIENAMMAIGVGGTFGSDDGRAFMQCNNATAVCDGDNISITR